MYITSSSILRASMFKQFEAIKAHGTKETSFKQNTAAIINICAKLALNDQNSMGIENSIKNVKNPLKMVFFKLNKY